MTMNSIKQMSNVDRFGLRRLSSVNSATLSPRSTQSLPSSDVTFNRQLSGISDSPVEEVRSLERMSSIAEELRALERTEEVDEVEKISAYPTLQRRLSEHGKTLLRQAFSLPQEFKISEEIAANEKDRSGLRGRFEGVHPLRRLSSLNVGLNFTTVLRRDSKLFKQSELEAIAAARATPTTPMIPTTTNAFNGCAPTPLLNAMNKRDRRQDHQRYQTKVNIPQNNSYSSFNALNYSDSNESDSSDDSDSSDSDSSSSSSESSSAALHQARLSKFQQDQVYDGEWETIKTRQKSRQQTRNQVRRNRVEALKLESNPNYDIGKTSSGDQDISSVGESLEDLQYMEEDVSYGRQWGKAKKGWNVKVARQRQYAIEKRNKQRSGRQ